MTGALSIRPVGEHGLLVELPDNAAAQQLARFAREVLAGRVQEVVPGHATVLIVGAGGRIAVSELEGWRLADQSAASAGEPTEIPVTYDGPDLEAVATACGTSPEEVVDRHTQASYSVAFLGFAPGFAYLIGGDERLRPGRREEPRERVPAGAVAIAGEYSAVYPRASPGGWQLIGSTELAMFAPHRDPPALVTPGTPVRFRRA